MDNTARKMQSNDIAKELHFEILYKELVNRVDALHGVVNMFYLNEVSVLQRRIKRLEQALALKPFVVRGGLTVEENDD